MSRDTAAALAQKAAERQNTVGADLAGRIKTAEANIATAAAAPATMAKIQTVAADIRRRCREAAGRPAGVAGRRDSKRRAPP